MKIFVTGATGFVGSPLVAWLLERRHEVTGTGRRAPGELSTHRRFRFVSADTTRPGPWQEALAEADAVVNLAGQPLFGRWTDARKRQIRESRILTTRHVVDAMARAKPAVLVSASGVGFYGGRGDDPLTESEPAGEGFIARLAVDWEAEALKARAHGHRVVLARLGIVLGSKGGALAQMLPAFKAFLGGPLGSGRQWFPWIHQEDLLRAIAHSLEDEGLSGPVNACSPNPVRHRDLARALGKVLGRPAVMPAPAFMVRLVLGEFGGLLLDSQRALPDKLVARRFRFRHADILRALQSLIHGPGDEKGADDEPR
jgi:hypothetical protein